MATRREQVVGSVLAAACGDALGYQVEFSGIVEILGRYPEGVRDLPPGGRFSDDTQMSVAVIRGLLDAGRGAEPDVVGRAVAARFVEWHRSPDNNRAPGGACMAGCRSMARGTPWMLAGGTQDGGCGSVMRAHPYALWFWDDLHAAVGAAVAHSAMTHRHPLAFAACAALATGVHLAMGDGTEVSAAKAMASAAQRFHAETANMIRDAAGMALDGCSPLRALDRFRGWAAHEAIAAAVFCWLAATPCTSPAPATVLEDAVVMAATSPGDSDSIASITGALVGARYGVGAIPSRWLEALERGAELRVLAEQFCDACEVPA